MKHDSTPHPADSAPASLPLCVDCDGTLIHTDLLFESFLLLLKSHFLQALCVPFWLLARGKAWTKLRIAELIDINAGMLPYSTDVLEYIAKARAEGRTVVLATASARKYAEAIADHLKCFDMVLATDAEGGVNLSRDAKAQALNRQFGEGAYEYLGNSEDDLPVWKHAARATLANASPSLLQRARELSNAELIARSPHSTLRAAVKSLRLHQWLKNLLVFIPLLMAHRFTEPELVRQVLLAFVAFGLCASSVYVLNDMLDIDADRAHPRKKFRPFASGALPIPLGAVLLAGSLGGSVLLLTMLPGMFALMLAIYYVTTLAYSFRLKRQVMVDIMLLSGLYTMRILAGAAATNIVPSFWLLSFSIFIFLSLALVKRYAEMVQVARSSKRTTSSRGYSTDDLPLLLAVGAASGFSAVQVLTLYINSPEVLVLYRHPQLLWLIMPMMLYWISRIWLKTHRGEMHDDPVVFAAKDWQSLIIGAAIAAVGLAASLRF